ncbi:MAG: hypothetical protein LBR19_03990 [Bifidobacteriaceae bacterium]|nr:hypothetical protein [Bifidobacteriaceae bacterium]
MRGLTGAPARALAPALGLMAAQALVGLALGYAWLRLAPRPQAYWTGYTWYSPEVTGFGAAQDVLFGALTVLPGLAAGVCLVLWAARPWAAVRTLLVLVGAAVGSGATWLVGALASHAWAGGWAVGDTVTAPVNLTSPGVALLWPVLAALVPALVLSIRALVTDK